MVLNRAWQVVVLDRRPVSVHRAGYHPVARARPCTALSSIVMRVRVITSTVDGVPHNPCVSMQTAPVLDR